MKIPSITEKRFEYAFMILKLRLKLRYDIDVREFIPTGEETLHGLSDDRVADFDALVSDQNGRSIKLRADIPAEFKVFSLLHLFGHIVQMNESQNDMKTAEAVVTPGSVTPREMDKYRDYEQRAGGYGAAFLKDAGLIELTNWYADLSKADLTFLEDVYMGRKPNLPTKYEDVSTLLLARKNEYFKDSNGVNRLKPLAYPSPSSFVEKTHSGRSGGYRIL